MDTLTKKLDWALARWGTGQRQGTKQIVLEALLSMRKVLGDSHPLTLNAMVNLGDIEQESGRITAADLHLVENLFHTEKRYGEQHFQYFVAKGMVAKIRLQEKRYLEAAELGTDLITRAKQVKDLNQRWLMFVYRDQALVFSEMGRYAEADRLFKKVLAELKSNHSGLTTTYCLTQQQHYSNSFRWHKAQAAQPLPQLPPAKCFEEGTLLATQESGMILATAKMRLEWDASESIAQLQKVMERLKQEGSSDFIAQMALAKAYLQQGSPAECERILTPLLAEALAGTWPEDERAFEGLISLGYAMQRQNKDPLAIWSKGWDYAFKTFAEEDGRILELASPYAKALISKGSKADSQRAKQVLDDAIRRSKRTLGEKHERTREYLQERSALR